MTDTIRKCATLLGRDQLGRWALLVALALAASGLEVLGALLVFGLLARITTDVSGFDVPGLGDLRALLGIQDETTVMVVVGAMFAGFFVVRAALLIAQSYIQYRVAENAGARLSIRLLDGYLSLPYRFHLQRNSAELIRNAYDTVQQLVRDALVSGVKLVTHALLIAGLVLVLLVTSPAATLFAIAVLGPFTWLLLRVVHPRVKELGRTAQHMSKTTLQTLHESLGGWRDITILGGRHTFVQRYAADRRGLARARYLRATAREIPRVALETGLVLFILAFLGVSVIVRGGALEALPVLGLFGYAAVRLQPSLNEVLVALNALKFAGAGIDQLAADLALFEGADPQKPAVQPLPLRRELRLERVTARYPQAHDDALRDVDLTIRAGEFIGIVGPTGGGKSTLVDLVLGLLEPAAGAVRVDGLDVREHGPAWHASLGVVHQMVFLADTTLRRNIALGVPADDIDEERLAEAVALAQLDPFVRSLPHGLDTVVGERGVRVSGGQRQRVAIARALYRRPSVLVFDEGTSALDLVTESQLMEALAALRGQRTIIAVAHRLSTVHACDRVLLIDRGRLVDVAPFDELAARHTAILRS